MPMLFKGTIFRMSSFVSLNYINLIKSMTSLLVLFKQNVNLFIIHFHTRRTVHISSILKADSRRGRAAQAGILTQVSVSQLKASKPDIPSTLHLQTKDQKQHEHQYAALRPLVLAADRHLLPHHRHHLLLLHLHQHLHPAVDDRCGGEHCVRKEHLP